MLQEIKTISMSLSFSSGKVNCYLLKADSNYVLIDTGYSISRATLMNELRKAKCDASNLKLIILTHGDFDHVGNAAYLHQEFGTKIAMNYDDSGMVEYGNMFWNRRVNRFVRLIGKAIALLPPFRLNKSNRFTPDLLIEEGFDVSDYGLDAKVLSIPGHSKGSLGILTTKGDLFCGDLLINGKKPKLNSIIDDLNAAISSIEKLKSIKIGTVYPGHGNPFPFDSLIIEKR